MLVVISYYYYYYSNCFYIILWNRHSTEASLACWRYRLCAMQFWSLYFRSSFV